MKLYTTYSPLVLADLEMPRIKYNKKMQYVGCIIYDVRVVQYLPRGSKITSVLCTISS